MSPLLVFGGSKTLKELDFDLEPWQIDAEAGEWIQCPECGSENAYVIFWEKTDFDFGCIDCPTAKGVR